MLGKLLREIAQRDLQELVAAATPEGIALEFKRELNLDQTNEKREAAKDISALANTAGGRILYGIEESRLPDGSSCAGKISPLLDGAAPSKLANVLHSAIQPRPRFDMVSVPVPGGFVLVVEVYPSTGLDLHMVAAYGDARYYRRGPTGVVSMTEPEIREAYVRIGELRASLDVRVATLAGSELQRRASVDESILSVPLYSRPSLADPRQLRTLGNHLRDTVLQKHELRDYVHDLRLRHDGYRLVIGDAPHPPYYLAVLKSGVVHYSTHDAFEDKGNEFHFHPLRAADHILVTLMVTREVLRLASYSGPARVMYQLRPTKPWRIEPSFLTVREEPIPPGVYESEISEVNLGNTFGRWGLVVKDLLDPIYHAGGRFEVPHFDTNGALAKKFASDFAEFGPCIQIQT